MLQEQGRINLTSLTSRIKNNPTNHNLYYLRAKEYEKYMSDQNDCLRIVKMTEADYNKAIKFSLSSGDTEKRAIYLVDRAEFYTKIGRNAYAAQDMLQIPKLGIEKLGKLEQLYINNILQDLARLQAVKQAFESSGLPEDALRAFYDLIDIIGNLSVVSGMHSKKLEEHDMYLKKHDDIIKDLIKNIEKLQKDLKEISKTNTAEIEKLKFQIAELMKIAEELNKKIEFIKCGFTKLIFVIDNTDILLSIINKEKLQAKEREEVVELGKNIVHPNVKPFFKKDPCFLKER